MSAPWETLWDRAMTALDSLKPALGRVEWSFGGGTAMRLFYDHRESKDIDIFVTDTYVISGLSPRLNSTTEHLTGEYDEQSNYLKLNFPEGQVDFIIGGKVIANVPFADRLVRGRSVKVEMPIEIVAKKCFYRADLFTARDIFDLALLINEEPAEVEAHRDILLAKRPELERRLGSMRVTAGADPTTRLRAESVRERVQEAIEAIDARPRFIWLKSSAIETVLRFLDSA